MSTWIVIAAVALCTFGLRASFILFADPHRFPRAFRQALTFVPPSVLAAIVVPGLALVGGELDLSLGNPRWAAGLIALAVAAHTRSSLAAIVSGMGGLWLLQWAMG